MEPVRYFCDQNKACNCILFHNSFISFPFCFRLLGIRNTQCFSTSLASFMSALLFAISLYKIQNYVLFTFKWWINIASRSAQYFRLLGVRNIWVMMAVVNSNNALSQMQKTWEWKNAWKNANKLVIAGKNSWFALTFFQEFDAASIISALHTHTHSIVAICVVVEAIIINCIPGGNKVDWEALGIVMITTEGK